MARYQGTADYRHDTIPKVGVLLINLGTPEEPTARAVRRYLAEFLWDPRVVELPRPLWWLILHGVILRTRPARSAEAYRKVWTEDGSPLMAISRRQADALQTALAARFGEDLIVAIGMRYGRPSIAEALRTLGQADVQRLVVLPLYPQYAGATTGTAFDAVAEELRQWRWVPALRLITHYHDQSQYIAALSSSIREAWQARGRGERLLFSFHGLPQKQFLSGDPYHCHCQKTARLVAETLDLPADSFAVSFQSRLGRAEWLRPYTDELLKAWGAAGVGVVDVVCPGFSADCLETLEEIAMTDRDLFIAAGGRELRYIPALNDRPDHIAALAELVAEELPGWIDSAGEAGDATVSEAETTRRRAQALGAPR